MGISELAVILMSPGVAPANFKVAELFCRNRFGKSAVDMGFERGLVVACATGWTMSDEEQMEEVEQRIRDEEPVLLIGSPMCRTFSTLIELTQAGKPSEFEFMSLVERCVTHLSEMREDFSCMSTTWDAWSRGLSFVNEMAEKDCVHKTKGDLCRFQLSTNSVGKGSWFMSNSESVIEELSKRCYNNGDQAKNHMKNSVVAVLKGLKREINSVKAIGSMEVGVTCEEPNVLELDDYAEELQNAFDSISGVRLDPELLNASRKVEVDFMSRLEVYRKRPRNWAKDKGIHVIEHRHGWHGM